MNIAEFTGLAGGAAAVMTSGGALYISTRSARQTAASNMILSWESLAKERNEEIIKVRTELREAYVEFKRKLRDLERADELRMAEYRHKIASLESQILNLTQQLARKYEK